MVVLLQETVDVETRSESWLLYCVAAIVRKATERALSPLDLSVAQMAVLVVLRDSKRPIMTKELAARLHLESPSVTTMIDRLERSGLIKRVADSKDRRKRLVDLTPKGRNVLDRACGPYRDVHDLMFNVLDDDERDHLITAMQKFCRENLYLLDT
jgi:DNA-binding MarR family transcriptional regulator